MAEKVAPIKLRPRISLATLVSAVFCLASAALMFLHWEPWVMVKTTAMNTSTEKDVVKATYDLKSEVVEKVNWTFARFSKDIELLYIKSTHSAQTAHPIMKGSTRWYYLTFPMMFRVSDGEIPKDVRWPTQTADGYSLFRGISRKERMTVLDSKLTNPLGGWAEETHWGENIDVIKDTEEMRAISPDEKYCLIWNTDTNENELYNLESYSIERVLDNTITGTPTGTFSINSRYAVIWGFLKDVNDEPIYGVKLYTVKEKKALFGVYTKGTPKAQFSPDEKIIFVFSSNMGGKKSTTFDSLSAMNVESGAVIRKWQDGFQYSVGFSEDGQFCWVQRENKRFPSVESEPRSWNTSVYRTDDFTQLGMFSSRVLFDRMVGSDGRIAGESFTITPSEPRPEKLFVYDSHKGALRYELPPSAQFHPSGDRAFLAPVSHTGFQTVSIYDGLTGTQVGALELKPLSDVEVLDIGFPKEPSQVLLALSNRTIQTWERRRPEYWWGIFYRYECWLALLTLALLLISFYRDMKTWRKLRSA